MTAAADHGTVTEYNDNGCRCFECLAAIRERRQQRRRLAQANGGIYPGPITHGLPGTYGNYGCRCPACNEAHRVDAARGRAGRVARTRANGGIAPIDTHNASTYGNWGCRCGTCRSDRSLDDRARGKATG